MLIPDSLTLGVKAIKIAIKRQAKAKRNKKNYPSCIKLNTANYSAKNKTEKQYRESRRKAKVYFKILIVSIKDYRILSSYQCSSGRSLPRRY